MAEPGFAQVPSNQNIHAPPQNIAPPPPRFYTYSEAYDALAREPRIYQVYINNKRSTLLDLFKRLQDPTAPIPEEIRVRHPDIWSVLLYHEGGENWIMNISPPLSSYGVLTRSYGSIHLSIPENNLFSIWEVLLNYFPALWDDIVRMQILDSKAQKMRANAIGSLADKANIPENMVPFLESYVLPRPRVKGWATGQSNLKKIKTNLFTNGEVNLNRALKKINTTLFTKGGKRKTRRSKTRKQRK
jgi:hypothetical protein